MNKTERLYAVAEELRRAGRAGTTGARLARLFEVSERTVKRDVAALQQTGLPVWAQAGPGGGYVLDSSATLPPVNFTPQQAVALAVALAMLPPGSPFAVDAAAAQGKIWDALGPQARERASALAGRVWVDRGAGDVSPNGRSAPGDITGADRDGSGAPSDTEVLPPADAPGISPTAASRTSEPRTSEPRTPRPSTPAPRAAAPGASSTVMRAVEESIARHRVLAIRYRDGAGSVSSRQVEPVLLAHTGQAWFLIAWCRTREAVRWFRLDRVERADLTAEPYEPRPVVDVGEPRSSATPVA